MPNKAWEVYRIADLHWPMAFLSLGCKSTNLQRQPCRLRQHGVSGCLVAPHNHQTLQAYGLVYGWRGRAYMVQRSCKRCSQGQWPQRSLIHNLSYTSFCDFSCLPAVRCMCYCQLGGQELQKLSGVVLSVGLLPGPDNHIPGTSAPKVHWLSYMYVRGGRPGKPSQKSAQSWVCTRNA